MASKSFDEVLRDLRNKIYSPVYLLTGDEPYFIDRISDTIEKSVLDDNEKEFNQSILYGRECDPLQLVSTVKRYPMMANYQVVIVREAQEMKSLTGKSRDDGSDDGKDEKNPLVNYFLNPLSSTVLVLCMKYKSPDKRTKLYKAIDKNGTVMVSKKLYDNQLAPWIQKFLESKKHKIQPKAAQLMADHLGNDLSRIANECEKLLISLKEGEEITSDLVAANIGISKDFNVFELQAALSSRDMLKANRIVNYFRANPKANPFVMTIAILFAYFSKILLYHTLQDKTSGAVAGALKISPGFAEEYRRAASVFSFEKTTEVISLLREYDLRSKGVNNAASEGDLLREMIYRILH